MTDYYRLQNDMTGKDELHYPIGVFIHQIDLPKEFEDRIYGRLTDILVSVIETYPEMKDGHFDIFTPSLYQLHDFVDQLDNVKLSYVDDIKDFDLNPSLLSFHVWATKDSLESCYNVYRYVTDNFGLHSTFEVLGTEKDQKELEEIARKYRLLQSTGANN